MEGITLKTIVTEEELLSILKENYSNQKVKSVHLRNLKIFFEETQENVGKPLLLSVRNLYVMFGGNVLFLLDQTNSVQYNAVSVIRDIFNIFYDGEEFISRKFVEKLISFQ